ncbi:hypothetical protein SAMN02745146_2571 [Hymenobacter daecheongensis DSM 21074]|uniref:DUF6438 domain-containing protein n=1 Tax=Hymenobacter daecheongensis DSM 21074 TaxID=1121955 RepID=A0A1M6HN80_9BACT|nr:DUF6438 domain-containing protein [Hymenobacter daecheongensis]SHJ23608.1 hypothetical protein SAMN02745146_2571 [Hymenobacter daecheongensis DSM 21074]
MKHPLLPALVLLGLGLTSCTVNYYGLDHRQSTQTRRSTYHSRGPAYYPPGGGQIGGVRPPVGGSGPDVIKTPSTGGTKPPTGSGQTGGIKTPPPTWETGGIKSPPPTGGETGGIKTPPPSWETGGIKTPPAGSGPVTIKPPVEGETVIIKTPPTDWQTGGIKPPSAGGSGEAINIKPPAEDEIRNPEQPPVKHETGGIKPPTSWETGGIKMPLETTNPTGGGKLTEIDRQEPLLIFAKTPCMGLCPDFTATFWADGRVTYEGRQHVASLGTHQLQLPADRVSDLVSEAQNMGFAEFKSRYTGNTSDLPSTILTIRQPDGSSKTVQAEEDAPAALLKLFAHISGELDALVGAPADLAK